MKKAAIYVLMFLFSLPLMAQEDEKSTYNKEKLESAKVAFITQRLDLTPEQAEKFWPLYHQHSKAKRSLMKEMNGVEKSSEAQMSDQKAAELIERRFEVEQKILDLDKAFLKNIVTVISPIQAFKLDDVNKDFARHIYRMQKRDKEN
ncbi:MAG TPA: Spy/CpxP family protein refolding chaperone [Cyclobacteriaceae bacterium]|nr:Spy/CpxP family protein refolding chaperone [Cyclobacteriaceae bacterium]